MTDRHDQQDPRERRPSSGFALFEELWRELDTERWMTEPGQTLDEIERRVATHQQKVQAVLARTAHHVTDQVGRVQQSGFWNKLFGGDPAEPSPPGTCRTCDRPAAVGFPFCPYCGASRSGGARRERVLIVHGLPTGSERERLAKSVARSARFLGDREVLERFEDLPLAFPLEISDLDEELLARRLSEIDVDAAIVAPGDVDVPWFRTTALAVWRSQPRRLTWIAGGAVAGVLVLFHTAAWLLPAGLIGAFAGWNARSREERHGTIDGSALLARLSGVPPDLLMPFQRLLLELDDATRRHVSIALLEAQALSLQLRSLAPRLGASVDAARDALDAVLGRFVEACGRLLLLQQYESGAFGEGSGRMWDGQVTAARQRIQERVTSMTATIERMRARTLLLVVGDATRTASDRELSALTETLVSEVSILEETVEALDEDFS